MNAEHTDLLGKTYYSMNAQGLHTYTLTELLNPCPDEKRWSYYNTEEKYNYGLKSHPDYEEAQRKKYGYFCTKYIGDGIYETEYEACQNWLSWYTFHKTQYTNTSRYEKDYREGLEHYNSKRFQRLLKEYPALQL